MVAVLVLAATVVVAANLIAFLSVHAHRLSLST
jgi:hypothetical protein